MKQFVALCVPALALFGCVTEAPAGPDYTGPSITLQVQNGVGGARTFTSTDPAAPGACAKVRRFPAKFTLSVGDPGGVGAASVRLFLTTFVAGSITTIEAPDVSYSVTPTSGGEMLTIRLTPPAPGSVRTGLVATFEAAAGSGAEPDFALVVEARDQSGNPTYMDQIDIRAENSSAICE